MKPTFMLSRIAAHSFFRVDDGILTAMLTPLSHNKHAQWTDNYLLLLLQELYNIIEVQQQNVRLNAAT